MRTQIFSKQINLKICGLNPTPRRAQMVLEPTTIRSKDFREKRSTSSSADPPFKSGSVEKMQVVEDVFHPMFISPLRQELQEIQELCLEFSLKIADEPEN